MKILFCLMSLSFLASCRNQATWTKEDAYKICMNESLGGENMESIVQRKNMYKFCHCMSEKLVARHTTEAAALKDTVSFNTFFQECVITVGEQDGK